MKRLVALLAVLFFVASTAALGAASSAPTPQSGRWELLRAEYGSERSFADVTARVRSLVQDGVLRMRVDNGTLGVDPAPGFPKILRLHVRGEDGRDRVLEYPERESLTLSIRRGDSDRDRDQDRDRDRDRDHDARGGPGNRGGLQILRADYGAGHHFFDVTARVASRIQGDALTLPVNNETMGGDPAEDHAKVLQVWYSYNGRTASAVVNEHGVLNLPSGGQEFQGRLRIMRAQYGVGHRYADVTDLLNSRIQGDQLNIRVSNEAMGGDPDPDQAKQLIVFYVFDGRASRITANEKSFLTLPGSAGSQAGYFDHNDSRLVILSATYGAGDRHRDVTALLTGQSRGNGLQLVVSNDSMGGDPAEGQRKRLRVIYLWQGMRNQIVVSEGETLSIP